MDYLSSIATFVKVVDAGGFASAGRKLGLSPSTVTTQVQALEERLGGRLLNRSTRKISLTGIGQAYYERCMHILADLEDADNVVRAQQSNPRGTLRLNVSLSVPFLLAPVIAEFTSLYPEVKLHMTMSDRLVDLIEEGIDLAISTLPVPNSNLMMRRVGSYRLLVCGAPSYFVNQGTPREPNDLTNHNCLKYSFAPWGSDWRFKSSDGGHRTVHVAGNMEANSANALKLAAVLGQGLILMPDFLVQDEIKSGKLVAVLAEYSCPKRPINAVYPHRELSANVRSFLDLVAKHFEPVADEPPRSVRDPDSVPAFVASARRPASAPLRSPGSARVNA